MPNDAVSFLADNPQMLLGLAGAMLLLVSVVGFFVWRRRREKAAAAESPAAVEPAVAPGAPTSPFAAFRAGLAKTRNRFGTQLRTAFGRHHTFEAWLTDLEEALLGADVGVATTQRLIGALRRQSGLDSPEALLAALKAEIREILSDKEMITDHASLTPDHRLPNPDPLVILVAGVNGVGKTTTIGKLAYRYRNDGKKVLMIAADTFRAAAIEQLEIWAARVGCDIVKHQSGADPSAVAFDGIKAARSRGVDVAIIDTAGRLHVKVNLMAELSKIVRVIGRELPGAPHDTLLVLDGTTGQNALSQARVFKEALPLSGVILTKLDGTTRGGAVLAVKSELGLPIRYVGLGEGLDDLRPFDADAFVDALFE